MKVFFLSNYFNHHQKFVSDSLELFCEEYKFIATSKMREERKKLGYGQMNLPEYVLDYSEDIENVSLLKEINSCDAVIIGSAPESYIKIRQKMNKLVFRYSERIYKERYRWYKWPFRLVTFYQRYGKYHNTYLLCSSAYTAADYGKHFSFLNKSYKWGYFPETKRYEDIDRVIKCKKKNSILWVGRFIEWKHPEDVVLIAKRLKDEGYKFELNFIGIGELENELRSKIKQYGLTEEIHMLGSMQPESVREYMEQAQVFLFTSDRKEGWGAVLNEAMNSGCAVVASHAIGSVPFLIKDNKNGLVYESQNVDMLYEKVKYLLDHLEKTEYFGKSAYQTIVTEWNAEVAAKRLVNLAEHILAGEESPNLYLTGPCSKAEIIKDGWYQSKE